MIPLLHDFTGETVLVFGGGPVGARKARRFGQEARVVVVSPEFADRSFGDAELIRAAPDPDTIDTWFERFTPALVVAATSNDAVNDAVTAAANDRSILVNRADRSSFSEYDCDAGQNLHIFNRTNLNARHVGDRVRDLFIHHQSSGI